MVVVVVVVVVVIIVEVLKRGAQEKDSSPATVACIEV